MDSADVLALIDALPGRRVAVIGDAIADEFVYGRVARVSRLKRLNMVVNQRSAIPWR